MARTSRKSRWRMPRFPLILAALGAVATAQVPARSQVVNYTFDLTTQLPDTSTQTANASIQMNEGDGSFTGSADFGGPVALGPIGYKIIIWAIKYAKPLGNGEIADNSLLDISNGNIAVTMLTDMGALGTNLSEYETVGTHTDIAADMSNLNVGALTLPPSPYTLFAYETVHPNGPGAAQGIGYFGVTGLGILGNYVTDYTFTGAPGGILPSERTLVFHAVVTENGQTATFNGTASAVGAPEPASASLALVGLTGYAIARRYKRRKATQPA